MAIPAPTITSPFSWYKETGEQRDTPATFKDTPEDCRALSRTGMGLTELQGDRPRSPHSAGSCTVKTQGPFSEDEEATQTGRASGVHQSQHKSAVVASRCGVLYPRPVCPAGLALDARPPESNALGRGSSCCHPETLQA